MGIGFHGSMILNGSWISEQELDSPFIVDVRFLTFYTLLNIFVCFVTVLLYSLYFAYFHTFFQPLSCLLFFACSSFSTTFFKHIPQTIVHRLVHFQLHGSVSTSAMFVRLCIFRIFAYHFFIIAFYDSIVPFRIESWDNFEHRKFGKFVFRNITKMINSYKDTCERIRLI